MIIKNTCRLVGMSLALGFCCTAEAQDSPFGQTFQINTHLNSYVGKPSWVIIIRDLDAGQVLPYVYDFTTMDNFWLGFTYSHNFQVISSELDFGPPNAKIHNFCHLENTLFRRESFSVYVSGDLTPNRFTATCNLNKYKEYNFPIADTYSSTTSSAPASTGSVSSIQNAVSAAGVPIPDNVANALSNLSANGAGISIPSSLTSAVSSVAANITK